MHQGTECQDFQTHKKVHVPMTCWWKGRLHKLILLKEINWATGKTKTRPNIKWWDHMTYKITERILKGVHQEQLKNLLTFWHKIKSPYSGCEDPVCQGQSHTYMHVHQTDTQEVTGILLPSQHQEWTSISWHMHNTFHSEGDLCIPIDPQLSLGLDWVIITSESLRLASTMQKKGCLPSPNPLHFKCPQGRNSDVCGRGCVIGSQPSKHTLRLEQ